MYRTLIDYHARIAGEYGIAVRSHLLLVACYPRPSPAQVAAWTRAAVECARLAARHASESLRWRALQEHYEHTIR